LAGTVTFDLKMSVFWVVAPCSLVEDYWRFRGVWCLYHQKMGETTGRNNPVDSHLHTRRRENLKSQPLTCIRVLPGLNLGRDTDYLNCVSSGFPQSLQVNTRIELWISPRPISLRFFQVHRKRSPYHLTQNNRFSWCSVVNEPMIYPAHYMEEQKLFAWVQDGWNNTGWAQKNFTLSKWYRKQMRRT
jgi:hypothetical protein